MTHLAKVKNTMKLMLFSNFCTAHKSIFNAIETKTVLTYLSLSISTKIDTLMRKYKARSHVHEMIKAQPRRMELWGCQKLQTGTLIGLKYNRNKKALFAHLESFPRAKTEN